MITVLSKQTGRARRAFLRDERTARSVVRVVRKAFRQESRAVQRAATGTTWDQALAGAISALDRNRWLKVLEVIYTEAAAGQIWKETQTALGAVTDDDPKQVILEYVQDALTVKADGILETTIKAFRRLEPPPLKASEGGLFRRAAAGLYQRFGSNRAARIAITETLQAASTVQHLAAKASATITRSEIFKVWETVGDENVRQSHVYAHGQRQPLDVPFSVGLSSLNYPRDPYGPPSEVANCRCWTSHETVGGISTEAGQVTFDPMGFLDEQIAAGELERAGRAAAAEQQDGRIRGFLERFRERRVYRTAVDSTERRLAESLFNEMDDWAVRMYDPVNVIDPAEVVWKRSIMERHGARLGAQFDDDILSAAHAQLNAVDFQFSTFSADKAENIAGNLVKTWANTSGDNNAVSLSMQRKIAELFDNDWPPAGYRLSDIVLGEVDDLLANPEFNKILEAFVRNVYEETQDFLTTSGFADSLGIDSFTMFRGGEFGDLGDRIGNMVNNRLRLLADPDPDLSPPFWIDRGTGEVITNILDEDTLQFFDEFAMNPGSSFSLSANKASEFAGDFAGGDAGQVLFGQIPIEKIWSTPFTGPGCYGEAELIVAGAKEPYEFGWTWWRWFNDVVGAG